ncbi:hypothetical protein KFE80_07670 [bacterium SCSIO 12696]|nr:hypothetical protein KFE80_07670 [bacterium SCSIO 12696]
MRKVILGVWDAIMNSRRNPLRHLDMASQHYFMHVLGWMWSMVFSLSALSILQFHMVWLAHVLLIAGVFTTVIVFKRAEEHASAQAAELELGHGSSCVWQLDREA